MTTPAFNASTQAIVIKEILKDLNAVKIDSAKGLPLGNEFTNLFERLEKISRTTQFHALTKIFSALKNGTRTLIHKDDQALFQVTSKLASAATAYVEDISQDKPNTPIKLAPALMQVLNTLGQTTSPTVASEIFMPIVPQIHPHVRSTALSPEDYQDYISARISDFNQNVTRCLKESSPELLTDIRQLLVTLEPKNPYYEYKPFFEVSIASIDILNKDINAFDKLARQVLAWMNAELTGLSTGTQIRPSFDGLSSGMHFVARADSETSARVRRIHEEYKVKKYLADSTLADSSYMVAFQSALLKLSEQWSTIVLSNDALKLQALQSHFSKLNAQSPALKNPGFSLVMTALTESLEEHVSGKNTLDLQTLAREGAAALLILEEQLKNGSHLDTAKNISDRLRVAAGKQQNIAPRVVMTKDAITAVSKELLIDLKQYELFIQEYFNNKKTSESELRAGLVKTAKILNALSPKNSVGEAFLAFEQKLKGPFTESAQTELAEQYTQLSTCVEMFAISPERAYQKAKEIIHSYSKDADTMQDESYKDKPNEQEIFEIFLEEADTVLSDLNTRLHQLRHDPSMFDLMTHIMRGYHTLKGSGRMIGLTRFGNLSYIGELLVKNWISMKKIPSPDFLNYMARLTNQIEVYIKTFKEYGEADIDYVDFEAEAVKLGGTPLHDAPQTKSGATKFSTVARPQGQTPTAPAAMKIPVVEPAPFVLPEAPVAVEPAPFVLPEAPVAVEPAPFVLPEAPVAVEPAPFVLPEAPVAVEPAPFVLPEAPVAVEPPAFVLPEVPVAVEPSAFVLPETPASAEPPAFVLPEAPVAVEPAPFVLPEAPVAVEPPAFVLSEAPVAVEPPAFVLPEAPVAVEPPAFVLPEAPIAVEPAPFVLPEAPVAVEPPAFVLPEAPVAVEPPAFVLPEAPVAVEPPAFVLPEAPVAVEPAPFVLPEAPVAVEPSPFVLPEAPVAVEPPAFVLPEAPVADEPAPFVLPEAPVAVEPAPFVLPEAPVAVEPSAFVLPETPASAEPPAFVLPESTSESAVFKINDDIQKSKPFELPASIASDDHRQPASVRARRNIPESWTKGVTRSKPVDQIPEALKKPKATSKEVAKAPAPVQKAKPETKAKPQSPVLKWIQALIEKFTKR